MVLLVFYCFGSLNNNLIYFLRVCKSPRNFLQFIVYKTRSHGHLLQAKHFQMTYSDRQDRAKPISIVLRHVGSPASGFGSCWVLFPVISAGICGRFGIQSALFKPKTVEVGVTKNKIERPSVLMHKSAQYSKFQVRIAASSVTSERFCRLCCAFRQVCSA